MSVALSLSFFFYTLILGKVIVVTEYGLIICFKPSWSALLFAICLFFFNLKKVIVLTKFCDSNSVE